MLTKRQLDLLRFIRDYIARHEVAPNFDEMSAGLDMNRSSVHRLVVQLEERGAIRRLPGRARAMEVLE